MQTNLYIFCWIKKKSIMLKKADELKLDIVYLVQ